MIREQPQSCAAITALRPTVPAPKIAMDVPASGRRELMTAPAPVCTPQPSGPNNQNGASRLTLTVLRSRASA